MLTAAKESAAQEGRSEDLSVEAGDAVVPVAPLYLRKAISELCDNAFKFSPTGTTVSVSFGAGTETVLEVVDRGKGMSPDQVGKIGAFQQFGRGRFEQQGSGVGLALVRGIAEASGGHLEIISRPGEGTTVRVLWPVRRTMR